MVKLLAILLIGVRSAIGQTATVFINDSNGNQTTGTINGGNVFFSTITKEILHSALFETEMSF